MRYGAEHKEETRKRVLKAAAKAIRAEGPHRVGVAGIMAEVGLTHGGFYAHFKSKDDLVAASIDQMFEEGSQRARYETEGVDPVTGLGRYIDFYLSPAHRDAQGAGCPLPYLSADAARMDTQSRARFADGVAQLRDRLARLLAGIGDPDPLPRAASLLSEMVGALSLARADPDPERSGAILEHSRAAIMTRFGLSADPSSETSP